MKPRFELRSCRTGHLEEIFGDFSFAVDAADNLVREFGGRYCITDAELPPFASDGTPDVRVIWRQDDLSDAARRWIVHQNRTALAVARIASRVRDA